MRTKEAAALILLVASIAPSSGAGLQKYWWMKKAGVFGTPGGVSANWNQQQQQQPQAQPSGNINAGCTYSCQPGCVYTCDYNPDPTPPFPSPAPSPPASNANLRPQNNFQTAVQPRPVLQTVQPRPVLQTFAAQPVQQFVSTGSCPVVGQNLPPVEFCAGRASNCWSVGQPDVDCPRNALCCFDGCANTCYYGGGQPAVQFPQATQVQTVAASNNQAILPAQQTPQQPAARPQRQPVRGYPRPQRRPVVLKKPVTRPQQQLRPVVRPQQQLRPVVRPQQQLRPVVRPQQQQRPVARPQQQQRPQPPAETKPFVMCPSAMLCVPRVNCDLKGVITQQTLNLTPQLRMLSVPLIPCWNQPTQTIDVCCRDPNYQDPWPMMNKNND